MLLLLMSLGLVWLDLVWWLGIRRDAEGIFSYLENTHASLINYINKTKKKYIGKKYDSDVDNGKVLMAKPETKKKTYFRTFLSKCKEFNFLILCSFEPE